MPGRVSVGTVGDLADGDCLTAEVAGTPIAVWHVGGQYFALEDRCPHAGAPLSDGIVDGTTVTCPWHDWCFDLATGGKLNTPKVRAKAFAVTVEGGRIVVEVP